MKRTIYLAGPMESVSFGEAKKWREEAIHLLPNWNCLDPCRRLHSGRVEEMKSIFELDLRDINESDTILVNLSQPTIAMHGTAMEIFYAAYVRRIPVVAFKETRDIIHPFFESLVTEWRSTLDKACDTLNAKYL